MAVRTASKYSQSANLPTNLVSATGVQSARSLLVRAALQGGEQLLDDVDRDGEADTDIPGNRALDRVVDADDLALGIKQRTAGVAGIDRGVGLDEAAPSRRLVSPVQAGDNPGRHRPGEPEGCPDRVD